MNKAGGQFLCTKTFFFFPTGLENKPVVMIINSQVYKHSLNLYLHRVFWNPINEKTLILSFPITGLAITSESDFGQKMKQAAEQWADGEGGLEVVGWFFNS